LSNQQQSRTTCPTTWRKYTLTLSHYHVTKRQFTKALDTRQAGMEGSLAQPLLKSKAYRLSHTANTPVTNSATLAASQTIAQTEGGEPSV